MKKKNTLLIKGYFEEGCKKNNSLKIMLDQKELNVAIDEEINQGIALNIGSISSSPIHISTLSPFVFTITP